MPERIDPIKRRARQRVNAMVYRGAIPSARTLPCSECGMTWVKGSKPHVYHHPSGYEGENAVKVVPLCNDCHLAEHGNSRTRESDGKVRSVRLDSDVWEAVRAMKCSLNQYLRSNLLGEMRLAGLKGTITVEETRGKVSATVNVLEPARSRKVSKKAAQVEALKASDPMAAERPEIDYAAHDQVPSGGSVSVVGAAVPVARTGVRPHTFHSGTRPIAGCAQCQELVK